MNDNITVNEMVENLQDDDIPISDQVYMFVQLCNQKTLIAELKKSAVLVKTGISPSDPVHEFAYGVLRLASPHLFEAGI